MPRARLHLSADDYVAAIRAYADRVHDGVRREGCTPAEAVEVVETSALTTLERLRTRPDEVTDVVGTWFREARALALAVGPALETGPPPPDDDAPDAIVRRSPDDELTRAALATIAEQDRLALLLRDAYDLPYPAVAVALSMPDDAARVLVARARLRLLAATGATAPEPSGHDAELADLGRLIEGGMPNSRSREVTGHLARCPICGPGEARLAAARRLLSGLAIVSLADPAREALLARVTTAARRALPSAATVAASVRAGDPDGVPRRRPPLGLVAGCIAVAITLGAVVAVVTSDDDAATGAGGPVPSDLISPTDLPTATESVSPSPTTSPTATVTSSTSASPGGEPTPSASFVSGRETLALSRTSGPNCTTIVVSGSRWDPAQQIRISYLDPLGSPTGSAALATPDSSGRFAVDLATCDPRGFPGPHTVRATNSIARRDATYTAT